MSQPCEIFPGGWLLPLPRPSSWVSHGPREVRTVEHGHESRLRTDVSWDGVVATVTVTGELDITTATGLARRLLAVAARHPERLVLDLGGLVFVDVAAAWALDDVHTLLQTECAVIMRQPRASAAWSSGGPA